MIQRSDYHVVDLKIHQRHRHTVFSHITITISIFKKCLLQFASKQKSKSIFFFN